MEKRTFKIPVGNIPEEEQEAYIRKVVARFKESVEFPKDYVFPDIKGMDSDITHASHYSRVVPNSQSFESLTNLVVLYDLKPEDLTKEYLLTGFKNTVERGLDIQKIDNSKENLPIIFKSIEDVTHLIENDPRMSLSMLVSIIKSTIASGYDLKMKTDMTKKDVYSRVDGELDYQELKWVVRRDANGTPDESKPPAEWINYMEYHIAKAKEQVYLLEDEEALAEIRKVVALGVRALMIHGCPERVIPEELKNQ